MSDFRGRGRGRGLDRGQRPRGSGGGGDRSVRGVERGGGRGGGSGLRDQPGGPRGPSRPRGDFRGGRGHGQPAPAPLGPAVQVTAYTSTVVSIGPTTKATGVKRPSFGTAGRAIPIIVNCVRVSLPRGWIHQYDVTIIGRTRDAEKEGFVRPDDAVKIIQTMQELHSDIFTPRAVYDSEKIMYSTVAYAFGNAHEFQFDAIGRHWKVRLQKVTKAGHPLNPEILHRYTEGNETLDENVFTVINACNVAIRMQMLLNYPFNVRSFYPGDEIQPIERGIELRRGYFQSIRPAIGQMVLNFDISTGAFYQPGPLIALCLAVLGKPNTANPNNELSGNMNRRDRSSLLKMLRHLRVRTQQRGEQPRIREIRGLSEVGAANHTFDTPEGQTTVAQFAARTSGRPLQYPAALSVQLSKMAFVPIELCEVVPGQLMKKQFPQDLMSRIHDFTNLQPQHRLARIRAGIREMNYNTSPYVNDFQMQVEEEPMSIQGRLLDPPELIYGRQAKVRRDELRDGAWNLRGKRLYQPAMITGCAVIVYDRRFSQESLQSCTKGLHEACESLGITGMPLHPPSIQRNPLGTNYADHIREVGQQHYREMGSYPNLVVVILPDHGADDIHTRIKHAGDVLIGVATQCLKACSLAVRFYGYLVDMNDVDAQGSKCRKFPNPQYFANVCLKINVKLGGINVVPTPETVQFLLDPNSPTLVIGADVAHPPVGSRGRASFASLVGSVDSSASKYIAITRPQRVRTEMMNQQNLEEMVYYLIMKYMSYRREKEKKANPAPRRILLYRDGVSEGEFEKCRDLEVPCIQAACRRAGLNPIPALTFVIVRKGHHVRFFPQNEADRDRSGNVRAGLVVDREIVSPVEFDFYLQSHGGLKGTSRSSLYNVIHDDNRFTPDALQTMTNALCYVYARATRSVSIVPPAYYADLVAFRAKHHFDPDGGLNLSDTASQMTDDEEEAQLQQVIQAMHPLHARTADYMYFQ
ncbi:hypothetical protein FRB99_007372 [Tulasnella sp. 403]|nr:hypothetical protein FRB99_007372 [Tulasnella sp. 403]